MADVQHLESPKMVMSLGMRKSVWSRPIASLKSGGVIHPLSFFLPSPTLPSLPLEVG